ncbi:lactonase family protein [Burkholderia pyrrocinia]|uniref:lactonase family protein n=1 Tax=Burkholderia pyrrocinia TaxID=60550 RepID=UPI001052B5D6|nr:beta-propeller fold lactonase family protein [Burkholderia pyrrocinia]TDA48903.1 3-carboxymuconate cyclase [Burkholderia pyrrocinia]
MSKLITRCVAVFSAVTFAACGGVDRDEQQVSNANRLFTQTNESDNAVLVFSRNQDGTLSPATRVSTGGRGTNGENFLMGGKVEPDSLASNHSVIVTSDQRYLFVVNSGDATVSTFSLDLGTRMPRLMRVSATGGERPTSLAYSNGILYVTHQTGEQQLRAYRVESNGVLTQIGAYTVVQANALPTSVTTSPDGTAVVVNVPFAGPGGAELNRIVTFPVQSDGRLGAALSISSQSPVPFGGLFARDGLKSVFVSANASGSLNTYTLSRSTLQSLSGPVVSGENAACWIAITPDNRFVYVGNGAGTVSSYSLDANGRAALLNAVAALEPAVNGQATSLAGDSWISPDGKYLYQGYLGADKVVAYAIESEGSLRKLGEQPAHTASGVSLQGMAGV